MEAVAPLVSTGWVAARLDAPDVRLCDLRWYLPATGRSGAAEYAAGHVPGAVFVDLDRELAGPDDGRAGRHPLPDPLHFERFMRANGISAATHVVVYDDAGGSVAARLWWLLRACGHVRVSLLDGGITAWKAEQRPLATAVPAFETGSFTARFDASRVASLDDVRQHLRTGGVLLDARAPERYRGEVEPVDPRPGHVPGAVNAPFAASLAPGGRLRPVPELRASMPDLPAEGVVASCGSGVTACHSLFVLDLTGLVPFERSRLYVGSYSEWSRRPDLPVVGGEAPGEPS